MPGTIYFRAAVVKQIALTAVVRILKDTYGNCTFSREYLRSTETSISKICKRTGVDLDLIKIHKHSFSELHIYEMTKKGLTSTKYKEILIYALYEAIEYFYVGEVLANASWEIRLVHQLQTVGGESVMNILEAYY